MSPRLGLVLADPDLMGRSRLDVTPSMTHVHRTFDFDADARWQSYRQKLEFPAGSDEATLLQRMKRKWYRREIDPSFDGGQRESP